MIKDKQHLVPLPVLHALNAIQYLRAMCILSEPHDNKIFSSCDEIAERIGAPKSTLWRTLMILCESEIVQSKSGPKGGYYITEEALLSTTIADVVLCLGQMVPDQGHTRASDRLNAILSDCLSVKLETFLK